MEDSIKRLEHLLGSKADMDSVKKLIAYIENKINYVFQMVSATNEEDALIARRNWFCLSCDKKLENYRGKIGQHLSSSHQIKGEPLKQEVVGGGMSLRSKSKVDLPTVNRLKK